MVESLTTGFSSVVCRRQIIIRGKKRRAIFKRARNPLELSLLKNEILFYTKLLPLYITLEKLHFTGKKFAPSFLKAPKGEKLYIEELEKYETKENLSFFDTLAVLSKLATFHSIGFFLRNITRGRGKFSRRLRGDQKWNTFVHGDAWCRNFMFRGKDVKLIDFGFYGYDNCLKDVVYLLFTSTRTFRIIQLVEYYKFHLSNQLRKLNLEFDTSNFFEELKVVAQRIYPLVLRVLKTIKSGKERKYQIVHSEFILDQLLWYHRGE